MEETKKNQMEILEVKKITNPPQKNQLWAYSRMEGMKERINELEERATEITKSEQQRNIGCKKMSRASGICGTITKELTLLSSGFCRKRG